MPGCAGSLVEEVSETLEGPTFIARPSRTRPDFYAAGVDHNSFDTVSLRPSVHEPPESGPDREVDAPRNSEGQPPEQPNRPVRANDRGRLTTFVVRRTLECEVTSKGVGSCGT